MCLLYGIFWHIHIIEYCISNYKVNLIYLVHKHHKGKATDWLPGRCPCHGDCLTKVSVYFLGLWPHQILYANNVIQVGVFGIMLAWTLFRDGIRLAKVIQLDPMFMKVDPNKNPHRKTQLVVVGLTFHTRQLWKWSAVHTTPQLGVAWRLTLTLTCTPTSAPFPPLLSLICILLHY